MKPSHLAGFLLLSVLLYLPLMATETTISLLYPSSMNLEGVLICPEGNPSRIIHTGLAGAGTPVPNVKMRKYTLSPSTTVHEIVLVDMKAGVHSFFVHEPGGTDRSPARAWQKDIVVRIAGSGATRDISPRADTSGALQEGRIWHVFDLDGSQNTTHETNYIFPFKRMVYGYIRDALSGLGIDGARVSLLDERNREVDTMQTESDGFYAFFPKSTGTWRLSVARKDCISLPRTVINIPEDIPARQDFILTRQLAANQLRVVLSWDRFPQDLDLYLTASTPGAQVLRLSPQQQKELQGQAIFTREDRDGYGPETITLNNPSPGEYTLSVHDNSGQTALSDPLMSSNATVAMYRGNQLLALLAVPRVPGRWWHVLSFDDKGTIKIMDVINDAEPGL